MTRSILGVDPGRSNGAAVLLTAHNEVAAWWTWCLMARKDGPVWRVSQGLTGDCDNVAAMWEVGDLISGQLIYDGMTNQPIAKLSLEGLFVPRLRRGKPVNPQSVIPLAEAAGELVGGLRMTPAHRPLATEWRSRQLGLRRGTSADAAEAAAVRMAPHAFTWPKDAGIEAAPTKAERGALAEAAYIARDGWVSLA